MIPVTSIAFQHHSLCEACICSSFRMNVMRVHKNRKPMYGTLKCFILPFFVPTLALYSKHMLAQLHTKCKFDLLRRIIEWAVKVFLI